MVVIEKLKASHQTAKQSSAVKWINKFLLSPYALILLSIITLLSFMFETELVLYTVAIVYAMYVALFCDDFSPVIPLFVLCYIAPSKSNNPGKTDGGLFYGASGAYILCLAAIAVVIILCRIGMDKSLGYKRLFTSKRKLWLGMVVLGAAYFISGLGSEKHLETLKSNLLFAFIQFIAIFLLYFILTGTVKWEKFNVDYFAWVGVMMGVVVTLEVVWIYITEDVMAGGSINRALIYSGWGCYNNIGALISMSVPFAFYLSCTRKHSGIYLLLACAITVGVIISCSRGSMVGAALVFPICFVYTFINAKHRRRFRAMSAVLGVVLVVGAVIFHEKIAEIFQHVPSIMEITNGSVSFNDSKRFEVYYHGLKAFLEDPIFGQTFYPQSYDLAQFSEVAEFSSFFPPRWHNTVVQLLACCGIVGIIAYGFHRFQTIRLYMKKRTVTNTFIALSILALLCMSLLDCHFFNVGPVLFYSAALAVMEKGEERSSAD